MKKLFALMLTLVMAVSMAACGGDAEPAEEEVVSEQVEETAEENPEMGTDDGFTLWDVPKQETPDLSDTTWTFCGAYMDGHELTQEEYEQTLEMYGGNLQFVFDANGGAKMVQGGGELTGTYEYLEDGAGLIFDNNGTELRYGCIFIDLDGLTMVAMSDDSGEMGLYFAQ